jgi:hypothetical protein
MHADEHPVGVAAARKADRCFSGLRGGATLATMTIVFGIHSTRIA